MVGRRTSFGLRFSPFCMGSISSCKEKKNKEMKKRIKGIKGKLG